MEVGGSLCLDLGFPGTGLDLRIDRVEAPGCNGGGGHPGGRCRLCRQDDQCRTDERADGGDGREGTPAMDLHCFAFRWGRWSAGLLSLGLQLVEEVVELAVAGGDLAVTGLRRSQAGSVAQSTACAGGALEVLAAARVWSGCVVSVASGSVCSG